MNTSTPKTLRLTKSKTTRTSQKNAHKEPPAESASDFAHYLVSRMGAPRATTIWDILTEQLLAKILPLGLESGLERIRNIRSAPDSYPDDLGSLLSLPPAMLYSVISEADGSLATYIELTKQIIPEGAIDTIRKEKGQLFGRSFPSTIRKP